MQSKLGGRPGINPKVPPFVLMSLEQRTFWLLFGVGLCTFSLYGPILGHRPDHNGFRYLMGPMYARFRRFCIIWPARSIHIVNLRLA